MKKSVTILSLVLIAFTAGAESKSAQVVQQIICKSNDYAVKISSTGQDANHFTIVAGQVEGNKIVNANRLGQRVCEIDLDANQQLKSLACAFSVTDNLPANGTFLMIQKDDDSEESFQFIQKVMVDQKHVQSKLNQEMAYDLKCKVN